MSIPDQLWLKQAGRRRWLTAGPLLTAAAALHAAPAEPAWLLRWRNEVESSRSVRPDAGTADETGRAASESARTAGQLRAQQRWVDAGEAALARLALEPAQAAFEQAAAMAHTAAAELGLVRTWLQAGEYRRAMAFVAHTASAHRDTAAGAAFYAWMLWAGGHEAPARRLLDEARSQFPRDVLLETVRGGIATGDLTGRPELLRPPARCAPYATALPLASRASLAWTGVALGSGRHVIAAAPAEKASRLVVRNALGQTRRVRAVRTLDGPHRLLLLELDRPFELRSPLPCSERPPFPGSVAYYVDFAHTAGVEPAWPRLQAGVLGRVDASGRRLLGITSAFEPGGGPVLDVRGQIGGLAVFDRASGTPVLLPISEHRPDLASVDPTISKSDASAASRVSVDMVYETLLPAIVRVLVVSRRAPTVPIKS